MVWSAVVSGVTSLAGDWLKNRREKSQAKHQAELLAMKNTASWEQHMAKASGSSWKDEWFTVLLSLPVIFTGWGIAMNDAAVIERIALAFQTLDQLPEWYQYLLFMAVSASFGIKGADRLMALKGKK